jgi:hypothetical protein
MTLQDRRQIKKTIMHNTTQKTKYMSNMNPSKSVAHFAINNIKHSLTIVMYSNS